MPRRASWWPTQQHVTTHRVDDHHDELLDYVLRLDPAWQDRLGAALRRLLPSERVTGFWLRTGTLDHSEAGAIGTLDLVVAATGMVAHLEFGAAITGQQWQVTTRTRAWPTPLIASIITETLPAEAGGRDGLLLAMFQPGGAWEVELVSRSAGPEAATEDGLAGAVHPATVRIVVEPLAASAGRDEQRRHLAELTMLSGLAQAVHEQLGRHGRPHA